MAKSSDVAAPIEGYRDSLQDAKLPIPRKYDWKRSSYTPELAAEICDRLAHGESLTKICDTPGMPSHQTVLAWYRQDVNGFTDEYTHAREMGLDAMADQMLDLVDNATPETAQVVRVQFDARRWYLSKLAPKRYGDKLELSGSNGGPIEIVQVDDDELARRVALLLSRQAGRQIEGKAQVIDKPEDTEA